MAEWESYAFQLNVKIVVNIELYICSLLARMVEFYNEWQYVVGNIFFVALYLLNFYKYKSEASAQNDEWSIALLFP